MSSEDASLPPWATPVLVGVTHRTAPVDLRERMALGGAELEAALGDIGALPEVSELVILSTCNRVELAAVGPSVEQLLAALDRYLVERRGLDADQVARHLFRFSGTSAVRHLFRVASSLDSMVVGEPQILGQAKGAYRNAVEAGRVGPVLNRLYHRAFRVAKRVRTETRIGDHAVSVGFAAVELAQKIFGGLDGRTVMLVGAGEMAELTARHLLTAGARRIIVLNRTLDNARRLAEVFHGEAGGLDELARWLPEADIVVCSTGASEPVLLARDVSAALKKRKNRSMFFIDIAVPRDIDPEVNRIDNAYLYDIDDLEQVVDENAASRRAEAARAESIVDAEVQRFLGWLNTLDAHPTIREIQDRWERLRQEELDRHRSFLARLPEADREAVAALTRSLMNKLLHAPVSRLKEAREDGSRMYVDAARVLFDLDDEGRSRR